MQPEMNHLVRSRAEAMKAAFIGPVGALGLHLVHLNDMECCSFWAGFYRRGALVCANLLTLESMAQMLATAFSKGIQEDGPVMICDAQKQGPRSLFLMPEHSLSDSAQQAWPQVLMHACSGWEVVEFGLDIPESLLECQRFRSAVGDVLRFLSHQKATTSIYLPYTSENFNRVLNLALELRNHIFKLGKKVWVLH